MSFELARALVSRGLVSLGILGMSLSASLSVLAAGERGFGLTVLTDSAPRPEYVSAGTVYVQALRGKEYALRLTNPLPYRVAVALSVDGLDTIDARHSDAWSAAKWVLDPAGTVVISGWQVSGSAARRFYFTGERHSYGAAMGQTQNLGVIEAVFYRERVVRRPVDGVLQGPDSSKDAGGAREDRKDREDRGSTAAESSAMGSPQPGKAMKRDEADSQHEPKAAQLSDDYAATGMGDRTRHEIESVHLDLEPRPVATVRIRYEFHPQLVKLGVFPNETQPLARREHASGFEGSYCPER